MIFEQSLVDLVLSGAKTQTRHPNKGYYQVGKTYSIQQCWRCKGIRGVRILVDVIWEEVSYKKLLRNGFCNFRITQLMPISPIDANEEGYMSSLAFEEAFEELYPKWDGESRWAYMYHIVREGKEGKK